MNKPLLPIIFVEFNANGPVTQSITLNAKAVKDGWHASRLEKALENGTVATTLTDGGDVLHFIKKGRKNSFEVIGTVTFVDHNLAYSDFETTEQ